MFVNSNYNFFFDYLRLFRPQYDSSAGLFTLLTVKNHHKLMPNVIFISHATKTCRKYATFLAINSKRDTNCFVNHIVVFEIMNGHGRTF